MAGHADVSVREQAKLYLEWADCARRDASRAIGRGARESYLAAAEQWDARAVDIKLKLWREADAQVQNRAPQLPKVVLDLWPRAETERYKREARRPRTPSPPVSARLPLRVPAELHCSAI